MLFHLEVIADADSHTDGASHSPDLDIDLEPTGNAAMMRAGALMMLAKAVRTISANG
jgi:hypothetical protein